MYKENLFLKIVMYGPLVFIPLLVGVILLISMQMYNDNFQYNLKSAKENLYTSEKEVLKRKINQVTDLIIYQKSIVKKKLKLRVQMRVETAINVASNIYNRYRDTKTDQEIKEIIKVALRPLQWNEGESFIWILDYDGIFHLAPNYLKELEDKSILDFKDATGRYVVKEEIKLCKKEGEGFLWDTFTKANKNQKRQFKQVSFVKSFGHFNWYFGSAEYLDTATNKTDRELIQTIEKVDNADTHYIFMMSDKGKIIMSKPFPKYIGKNIYEIDNKIVTNIGLKILKAIKGKQEASISYDLKNPLNKKFEEKFSYIRRVPHSNWIVGSGFFKSAIEGKLSKVEINMYKVFYQEFINILYLSLSIILLFLMISYYISKKLRKSFDTYEKSLDKTNRELKELNESLELQVETRTLEIEKIKDDFEYLATTDALTSIHNRYSLMKILSTEIHRCHRYKMPLSLLMYDIDFFKKVNDTYGHIVGDAILVSLSNLVKRNLREMDILGRYGGEEFLILLPNTTLEDAKHFSQRLLQEVETHIFEEVGHITISIGLAQLQEDESIDNIFKRVDDLLYKSKNDGKNRVSY